MSTISSLETVDDGLPLRDSGEWAFDKLFYVNAYLARFIVSMRGKNWRAINYIDLFSGPGKNKLRDGRIICGSPLLALQQKQRFDEYFFVDQSIENINALQARCPDHMRDDVMFIKGDANQVVNTIVTKIKTNDNMFRRGIGCCLNLAFLDPEGLELHWDTVAMLATCRTDMIIYYPQMGITREARHQNSLSSITSIDRFFGDSHWREIYQRCQKGDEQFMHRTLLDHYKKKLAGFGYEVEDPLPEPLIKNSKEAPLYRLLFVSKHKLGNRFWADITKRLPNGQLRLI